MRSSFCRLFSLAVLGMLAAAPVAADSVGIFRLDQPVQVGSVMLPAGVYVFRASDRGIVSVLDQETSKHVAVTLANRQSLNVAELDAPATLTHDWAVRTLTLGNRCYSLFPGKAPETVASRPNVTATVISLAR
jgi:hypothetical protein